MERVRDQLQIVSSISEIGHNEAIAAAAKKDEQASNMDQLVDFSDLGYIQGYQDCDLLS